MLDPAATSRLDDAGHLLRPAFMDQNFKGRSELEREIGVGGSNQACRFNLHLILQDEI